MFLELISTDNQISCNVRAARLLGLDTAIYLNELININTKAIAKQKVNDGGFFRLNRNYITDRTTLSPKRQLECDKNLLDVEIIEKDFSDVDLIKVDIEMYASIISNQELNVSKKVEKLISKKSKSDKDADKKLAIIENLKRSVVCSNEELRKLYYQWIDSVYDKPGGFLSKGAIGIFIDAINNYTKGDLDLAIELLKIAIVKSYKEAQWVINLYEQNKNALRTTDVRTDDKVVLSDISY